MPSTEERESQPIQEACPRCGSGVVLRNWKGRFYTKCQNAGCAFGYDADERGNPATRCGACGGRVRTHDHGGVCADCGARAGSAPQRERPAEGGLGPCPKCGKGQLAVRSGAYGTFVSCSERCGLTYSSDEQGVPEGGTCKACKGPVKKTQSGSRVCALCGTWQDERKPAAGPSAGGTPAAEAPGGGTPGKPKAANCPRCRQALRIVFTKKQKWVYRCDPCSAWYDA